MGDTYTERIDIGRAARIPAMQRAAREEVEYLGGLGGRTLEEIYARAVDDVLSWLDGEQDDSLIGSFRIRQAARGE